MMAIYVIKLSKDFLLTTNFINEILLIEAGLEIIEEEKMNCQEVLII